MGDFILRIGSPIRGVKLIMILIRKELDKGSEPLSQNVIRANKKIVTAPGIGYIKGEQITGIGVFRKEFCVLQNGTSPSTRRRRR